MSSPETPNLTRFLSYHITTCSGKKYLRLKSLKTTEDWAGKYKPFLVPSVNFPNMMFCALTNHVIQKKQAVVEEHLKVCSGERSSPAVFASVLMHDG